MAVVTPPEIIARLEEAGATLLALRLGDGRPASLRAAWPEFVRDAKEAYGYTGERVRPAIPDASAITRMDEALAWIGLIPSDRYVLRRIVGARALVSPANQRHLYTWRRLGRAFHCDHKAAQRWHGQGIDLIAAGLAQRLPIAHAPRFVPRF